MIIKRNKKLKEADLSKVITAVSDKQDVKDMAAEIIAKYATNESCDECNEALNEEITLEIAKDPEIEKIYAELGLQAVNFKEELTEEVDENGEPVIDPNAGIFEPEGEFRKWAEEANAKVVIKPEAMKRSTIYEVLDDFYESNMFSIEASEFSGESERAYSEADFNENGTLKYRKYDTVYRNLLLEGERGIGKTAVVDAWARDKHINIVNIKAQTLTTKDMQIPVITEDGETKKKSVKAIRTEIFKGLEKPNSVLFLDEYNTAEDEVRAVLYSLMNEHRVPDSEEPNGQHVFKNMLFTVAAINPANDNYGSAVHELNDAEKDRLEARPVKFELESFFSYIKERFERQFKNAYYQYKQVIDGGESKFSATQIKRQLEVNYGILQIINFLIAAPTKDLQKIFVKTKLGYDDKPVLDASGKVETELICTPRGFEKILIASMGDKNRLLKACKDNGFTNPASVRALEDLFAGYTDKDVKANQAIMHGFVTGIRPESERTTLVRDEVVDAPEAPAEADAAPEMPAEEPAPAPAPTAADNLRRQNRGSIADRLRGKRGH